ncbi:oxidoreductase [Melittangium boletus]|uniref:Probable oxidoreductase n=1 Tax=Melittangium boletus DSM 14713 TaxID=1294270 RepID=A0A250I8U5_9BACT|nr:oxidoreductase [Melittangium boletus]ATB27628.1 oxidoreductase [Melittangium boletus DSM 14713]
MRTEQSPLNSGFGFHTTAEQVLAGRDLRGFHAIVTGGYSGIGVETVRALVRAGARVVVPARDLDKARRTLRDIPEAELERLDLGDPESIDAFAARYVASGRPLHVLIQSAGVMACPLERDGRGFERQFATNHLGHFLLTAGLWPALRRAEAARVVSVSSLGHRICAVDFDDPHFAHRPYDKWIAYGQSKTANALFALELDRRARGHGVRAFSLHPGEILTDLVRHLSPEDLRRVGAIDATGNIQPPEVTGFKTVAQGAATQVWCATSPQLDGRGGVYCEDCDIAPAVGGDSPEKRGVRPWARDAAAARRLWELSEQQLGREFFIG